MWHLGTIRFNLVKKFWSSSCSQYPMSRSKRSGKLFAKFSTAFADTFLVPIMLRYSNSGKYSWMANISRSAVCRWAVKNNLEMFKQFLTRATTHPVFASTLVHQPKSTSTSSGKCDKACTPLETKIAIFKDRIGSCLLLQIRIFHM